jgi:hypothetical protein
MPTDELTLSSPLEALDELRHSDLECGWLTLEAGPYWAAAKRGQQSVDGLHSRLIEPGEQLRYAREEGPAEGTLGTISRFYFETEDDLLLSFEDHTVESFIERGKLQHHRPVQTAPLGPRQRPSSLAARLDSRRSSL